MNRKIMSRNAGFQELEALLTNRSKRFRRGLFVVHGVRPMRMALDAGWELNSVYHDVDSHLSSWAQGVMREAHSTTAVRSDLFAELSEKESGSAELFGVFVVRGLGLEQVPLKPASPVVVFDRPTQPGNLGAIVRSVDALGGAGVVTSGHAADFYDPKCVRASTGSLFTLPFASVEGPSALDPWLGAAQDAGLSPVLVSTDEDGDVDLWDFDFAQPSVVLIGNETKGLSRAWRDKADVCVRVPMTGAASSLNAANAATVVLYESRRQRLTRGSD
ncbi:TrmH family RNA methyltransferase [Demequina sediminicola]|uniref:TrmH family RNA methyltransferase n=1 Tax=Demequina sediminicola TaxID=1095026 RepID=UPI0007830DC4|nr:TrmH family RNA methyltransferase [Demequina sediminicola]